MCRFTIMVVVLAWLSGPLHVHAEELRLDGNKLLEYCTGELGTYPSGVCKGYMLGFIDTFDLFDLPNCMPDEMTIGQMYRIVVKYLQDHPARLHLPMVVLVNAALKEAFPCAAQPTPQ